MINDYVKSVKGTEFPRFFDGTTTQEQFDLWMEAGDGSVSGLSENQNIEQYYRAL